MRLYILGLLLAGALFAADSGLDSLRSTLVPMRAISPSDATGPRGATAELTVAKHLFRGWLDSRVSMLREDPDVPELQRNLNLELRGEGLFCDYDGKAEKECPDWTLSGFVTQLRVERSSAFLVIISGVGIECGFDESAYVYSWNGENWVRVWQNEQNTYTKDEYKPQTLSSVLISPYNSANDYLILTMGSESWCSSNWHDVYYRVFRLGPDQQAQPLINGSDWTAVGWRDPPIAGSLTADDVLIEHLTSSLDIGIQVREGVFHYKIEHGNVERIDPLALGPRDFVEEWLRTDWHESSRWSEDANRKAMLEVHSKFDKARPFGEFLYPTTNCPLTPDLWQVGIDFTAGSDGLPAKQTYRVYFLVRWRPPYQFRMVSANDSPSARCTVENPGADATRVLFPIQSWR